MLVSAVEKFAQQIPLNLEEIFVWYFEQKGVDNPERFLAKQELAQQTPETITNNLNNTLNNLPETAAAEQNPNQENPEKSNLLQNNSQNQTNVTPNGLLNPDILLKLILLMLQQGQTQNNKFDMEELLNVVEN